MSTHTLKLHKSSANDLPWVLKNVKELRQGHKIGPQIASFLNRSGIVIATRVSPDGRKIFPYDIPHFARMSGVEIRKVSKHRRNISPRKPKPFDAFKMIQDILSSNLAKSTQKILVAMLAKGVTSDA